MAAADSRYARALAAVVASQKLEAGSVVAQLRDFGAALDESPELREALQNPSITEEQKLKVLDALSGRIRMVHAVRNFVAVVIAHDRLGEFHEMVDAFAALADNATGVTDAEITSAHPLDAQSKSLLEQQVAKLAGGQHVRATYQEDATLLGGAIVRIGSTVYDGSVRAQLAQLKQRMLAAKA